MVSEVDYQLCVKNRDASDRENEKGQRERKKERAKEREGEKKEKERLGERQREKHKSEKRNGRGRKLVELTKGCYSGGDSQGLPG